MDFNPLCNWDYIEGGEGCMSRQGGSLLIGFFHQISGNTFNIYQTDSNSTFYYVALFLKYQVVKFS